MTAQLEFHKYQGLGNDFVLIDLRHCPVRDAARLSVMLCRRHFGVGADGLILVGPDPRHAARMTFYNPDGSRAEMCGNGLRCVAQYLRASGWERADAFSIMTDAGPREVGFVEAGVAASLGEPSFEPARLPAALTPAELLRAELGVGDLPPAVCLSVGNPHCVFFVGDASAVPVAELGPRVENLPVFPERINVEFAQVTAPGRIVCRVWERGAGETQACGTGAAATVVAATLRELVPGEAVVELPGGELVVTWRRGRAVTIAGRADEVFRGSTTTAAAFVTAPSPAVPS
jgi:diaminopimelate epimerase